MKDILEDRFNKVYKDYTEYKSFYDKGLVELEKERESFDSFVKDNMDDMEVLIEKLYDLKEKPLLQDRDFYILKNKVKYYYNAYQDVIDFPEDVIKIVNSIERDMFFFEIKEGEAKEVVTPQTEDFKKDKKEEYSKQMKAYLDIIAEQQ